MRKSDKIPIPGHIYNCYYDGKIRCSRQNKVIVKDVIKFEDSNEELKKVWLNNKINYDWIFAKRTDYFIKGELFERIYDGSDEEKYRKSPCIFARTQNGEWYTLCIGNNEEDVFDSTCNQMLDVSGKFTAALRRSFNRGDWDCEYYENITKNKAKKIKQNRYLISFSNLFHFLC